MNSTAKQEGLTIKAFVGDIYSFDQYQDFDVVLLDSMFHFEKRGLKQETDLIEKIAKRLSKNGLICICIQDTWKKVEILKNTFAHSGINYKILNDSSLIYTFEDKESGHKSETKYCISPLTSHRTVPGRVVAKLSFQTALAF